MRRSVSTSHGENFTKESLRMSGVCIVDVVSSKANFGEIHILRLSEF